MIASAFAYTALFFASVFLTGFVVWRALDDLVGEVRPLRNYAVRTSIPCWRCRRQLPHRAEKCVRCRAESVYRDFIVAAARQTYAIADYLPYGHFVSLEIAARSGELISITAPQGLVARPDDHLDLVFDRRRRLRALNNDTLGVGWRIPVRAMGHRSPLAFLGLIILVPAATLLILLAPLFFFAEALNRSVHTVSNLVATHSQEAQHAAVFDTRGLWALLLYILGLTVFGGIVLLARTRPQLNKNVHPR